MRIKPEQITRTLNSTSLPMYWLSGDEPLLMQEAADQIRGHFRQQGYAERELFTADKSFNWEQFTHATANLSLFSAQKILELRLLSAKLEDTGKESLQQFLDQPNPDYVLLISSPRLEAATLKTKWFKQIEEAGAFVQIWPVQGDQLRSWLETLLLREGIQADPAAVALLLDRIEGNLLAAVQEIEKLKLMSNHETGKPIRLDAEMVMQMVADSSRYNVYQLVDAALLGDAVRAQKILLGLHSEGIYPLVLLGAITYELRSLLAMLQQKEEGQAISGIVQTARIFFNRKQAVTNALQRLSSAMIWPLLNHARLIDQSIKGMSAANPWDELSSLLLTLSGVTIATTRTARQTPAERP